MTTSKFYKQDHYLAKLITCVLVICIGTLSLEYDLPYLSLVLGTFLWFFGVNTIGYIIEAVRHHVHGHNKV
jgi:hypothetical protein